MNRLDSLREIYLDMDGVLCDFARGSLRVHRRLDALENYPPGEWDIGRVIGLSGSDFWHPIHFHAELFWAELEVLPWAERLVEFCESLVLPGRVYLASCPSDHAMSAAGKLMWINRHFPQFQKRFFLTPNKRLLAGPGRLLIDDNDGNCMDWHQDGGAAFLWPQPWNAAHWSQEDRISQLKSFLGVKA